jgi:integrase
LARRRYQKGTVLLRGSKAEPRWFGRFWEDMIDESGSVRRVHRQEFLGRKKEGKGELATKKLAQRALENRLRSINDLSYRPAKTITFATFADRWESEIAPTLKPSTRMNYCSHVRRYLKPFFGKGTVGEITTEMVQAFISKLKANPLTIRHVFVTLQSILKTAREWGYTAPEFSAGKKIHGTVGRVRLPARVSSERRHFSLDEMVRIVATSPEPYRTCFWLAAETGMRAGELCGLRWQDLDLERLIVCVVQTAWWGHLQTPKTKGSARRFSISANLARHLQARLKEWKPNQYGLIFATRNGTAWTCRKPLRKLQTVLTELELPAAGLHAFRHAQVTIAEREGVPLKTVQARVGHDNAETTALYAHAVGEDDRKFSAWLGSQLNPEVKPKNPKPSGNVIEFRSKKEPNFVRERYSN